MTDDTIRLAEAKFTAGDIAGAYNDVRSVLRTSRHSGPAHYLMSRLAAFKGAMSDAITLIDIAIELDGASADYLTHQAYCHLQQGNTDAAKDMAGRALTLPSSMPHTYDILGGVFHALADYRKAASALRHAVCLTPSNDRVQTNLAAALALCGEVHEARGALAAALSENATNAKAYGLFADLRRATSSDNHIDAMKHILANEPNPHARLQLSHAMAREFDDMSQYDAAFRTLESGKSDFLARVPNADQAGADANLFQNLSALVDKVSSDTATANRPSAIFVTGMPRSGTTVVERILTNGPGVISIGESTRLADLARQSGSSQSARLVDIDGLTRAWPTLPFSDIGEAYLRHGRSLTGADIRIVDKMPLNVLLAPLILQALPGARIVCLLRHPLDTILGNYRQHFEYESGTYNYSLSLSQTATFVARLSTFAREMERRWPDKFHIVGYEALITAPVQVGRRLAEFCQLGWHDRMADIQANLTPASSASAIQVKSPIHSGFLARWKGYEAFLGPAKEVLDAHGIIWRP